MQILPKGLILKPDRSGATLDLYSYGSRYFTTTSNRWFTFYEELTPPEQQQLFGYFVKNAPGINPLSSAKQISEQQLKSIQVASDFPKIEGAEFCRLLKLYQHYCKGFTNRPNLEVGLLLFYHESVGIKFVLPNQSVSSGTWKWDINDDNKPLLFLDPVFNKPDGSNYSLAEIKQGGWEHIGTSHSHNTIGCTWSSPDYANQAGSKEKPEPPMLHLLVYAMANYQTDAMPGFKFLSSVNTFGDLIDVEPSLVIQDADIQYETVNWIGAEKAEQLAKVQVYQYQGAKYYQTANGATYYYGYNQLPPAKKKVSAPTDVVDAEAVVSWIAQKSTFDAEEASYRIELAVKLVQDLQAEDILSVISKLVDELSYSAKSSEEIYTDVLTSNFVLQEGMIDYFSGADLEEDFVQGDLLDVDP